MTLTLSEWFGTMTRAVLLAVVASLIPLRVAAADERPSSQPGPIKAAIGKIPTADPSPARTVRANAAPRHQQTGRDSSFFKTKPGVIALVVMAVGSGYALYSASNDRIKSPGKE